MFSIPVVSLFLPFLIELPQTTYKPNITLIQFQHVIQTKHACIM